MKHTIVVFVYYGLGQERGDATVTITNDGSTKAYNELPSVVRNILSKSLHLKNNKYGENQIEIYSLSVLNKEISEE